MSKTITIPKHNNPFIVNINNREFIYRGGDTIEVPDEVADAIADALALEPKPKRYLSKFAQLAEGSITEMTSIDFEGITKIGGSAFYNCKSVTKVTIPNDIKTIENFAFYACSKLESVSIGNNVTKIENNAFDWCVKLTSVYLPETPPTLVNINAFDNTKTTCIFYCKTQASLNAYKTAPIWSTLTGTYTFVVKE